MTANLNNFTRAVSIFLLACISCGAACAQRRDRTIFQFQHTGWTAKDGAPGSAWALAQTPDGCLWIGTPTGLYRFDGIRFELYQPPSGQRFPSDYINSLMATPDGGLWIGFRDGDADLLKDGRITRYTKSEGLTGGTVENFALDKNGVVWAATFHGLSRFDGSHWQTIGPDWGYTGKLAMAVFLDREGTVWAASEDSLFAHFPGSREFQKCADHLGDTASIGQTPDGTLWLSVEYPAQLPGKLTPDWTFRAIRPAPVLPAADGQALPPIMEIDAVSSSFIDHSGSLWIATSDGLIRVPYPERLPKNKPMRLDESTAQVFRQKDGLTSDFVGRRAMMEDSQGDIWVATATGLDRFRDSNVVPITSDLHRDILVAGNQGDAWTSVISFPKVSLVHLRGLTATSQPFPAFPSAGYRDSNGVIWLGGAGGLWKFENGRLARYPLPEAATRGSIRCEIQAITASSGGGLVVSFACGGTYRWANGVWTDISNRDDWLKESAYSLLTDSDGRTWFGYVRSRIALLDRGQLKKFTSTDGLQVGNVQAIYEHGGRIWIGGERGLALYRNDRFQSLTPDGDAAFAGVSGIVETANGDLWVNATPGIFHISAGEIERAIKEPAYHVRCELFGVLDGLNGSALQVRPIPTAVQSSDGLLWFQTTAGVVQINPNHLLRNAIAPSVDIRSVGSGGVVHSGDGALKLPARSTDVHIEYTAPNLSIPERVRYRYKLEGSDKDWHDAGTRREAFYTNLGPRHYRFRVIACNEDGVWNNVGAAVEFTIAPAWFQTYWFYALCACAFLLALWILYRIRVRSIQQRSEQLALINAKLETQIAENISLYSNLQRSEAYLAQGQSISHTGTFGRSVSSGETYWSEEAYKIFELDRSVKPTLERVLERIHPEDKVRVQRTIDDATQQRTGLNLEYRLLRPDDSVKYLHVVAQALEHPSGELEFVGTVHDITERMRADEALRQAQGDLARISRVTTMGELTASLAHEVSQPISGTITNANVSLRTLGSDKPDLDLVRTAVGRIVRDAQRAAGIIARIRTQFEKGAPKQEALDANEMIRETVALLQGEAVRHNISVRTELAADLPQIVGDRVQLQQVMMNLIVNSIEAMKDVDGTRELVIRSQRAENEQILVSVSDTGPGLPPQLAEQIFDPFFTTKPHGTGMGLRISRSIIESHGGRLWAQAAAGLGATFYFNLPVAIPGEG